MNAAMKGHAIGGKLNLREKPGIFSKSLVLIPNGAQIDIWEENSKWYKAAYQQYAGYVMKAYVQVEMQCEVPSENWTYAKVTVDPLNVRRGPSLSAARWNSTWPIHRIALVKASEVEGWYETRYRGETAYVSSVYMLALAATVSDAIPVRMMYMATPEIGRDNPRDFDGYTGPWCHRFADWLAMHAGMPKEKIPNTSGCGKGIEWFATEPESGGFFFKNAAHKARMIGRYPALKPLGKTLTPQEAAYVPTPGDYMYFRWQNASKNVSVSHVGIVDHVDAETVHTIEGNAGGEVARRTYLISDAQIVGYGHPMY